MTTTSVIATVAGLERFCVIARETLSRHPAWNPGVEYNGMVFGSGGPFIDRVPIGTKPPFAAIRADGPRHGTLSVFAASRALAIELIELVYRSIDGRPDVSVGWPGPAELVPVPRGFRVGPEIWQADIGVGWN